MAVAQRVLPMLNFAPLLLDWYDRHARALPWRVAPSDRKLGILPNPYHVWLSEVMLQQTTVATVKSYFEKFITLWPTLSDLAASDEEDVLKAWAGLGYYSRARNLKKCADVLARGHSGRFPETQAELIKLPGIGDYTSAAIAAIAFDEPAPVVDGNIERVVTRFTADSTPLPKVKANCRDFMLQHTPEARPGDFAQAMMDLGATICSPKNPACSLCPVNAGCAAHKVGNILEFPVKAAKKAKPVRKGAAFLAFRDDGALWLTKRADQGLLAGMTCVPSTGWTASIDGATGIQSAPFDGKWLLAGQIRHTFTHFHLELEIWSAETDASGEGWWSLPDELAHEALPTLFKKAVVVAVPDAFKLKN